jgi:3-dehydroquinate synthase
MEIGCKSVQDRSYRIFLEWDLLRHARSLLEANEIRGAVFVVSDKNVFRLHGKTLRAALRDHTVHVWLAQPGESSKSLNSWRRIHAFLLNNGADRKSTVIAFGGGVIGDLAGFAASTYMRGLDFLNIPTTLLSQSDSSIGAKVAVNHPAAKNLIGSFYQPRFILTDPSLLSTLPKRELAAGVGEVLKYGVIADPLLFEMLYEKVEDLMSHDRVFLEEVILRCVRTKIRVVEEDERETGLRKTLNFGHTIGHALEQATGFKMLRHGEAVAWGMLAAGWLACHRGMWETSEFSKLQSILFRAGSLHPLARATPAGVQRALKHDKKRTGKTLHFVLPVSTGKVIIVGDIPESEILGALQFIFNLASSNSRH